MVNVLVFKQLVVQRLDLDETVSYLAYGETLIATYEKNSLDPPEWLSDSVRALKTAVDAQRKDRLEARLKEAESRYEVLKPASEKRNDAANEVNRLRAQLGKPQMGAGPTPVESPAPASGTEG